MSVFTPADLLLIVAFSYALFTDLRTGLIYNHLTFPAMALGLLLAGMTRGTPGLLDSASGIVLGFVLLYIPYSIGWQGGGDVKLLMAAGALEGWRFALLSFAFYMAASFVLSIGYIGCKIMVNRAKGRGLVERLFLAVTYNLVIDKAADEEMLRTNVKWSPALFAGTLAALIYLRFYLHVR